MPTGIDALFFHGVFRLLGKLLGFVGGGGDGILRCLSGFFRRVLGRLRSLIRGILCGIGSGRGGLALGLGCFVGRGCRRGGSGRSRVGCRFAKIGQARCVVWDIIRAAGWPIWPLILSSIVALALIIERMWTLRQSEIAPRGLVDAVLAEYRKAGLTEELVARTAQSSPLG